jgi:hypothetical protein
MKMIRYVPISQVDKDTKEQKVVDWAEEARLIDNTFYVIAPVNV